MLAASSLGWCSIGPTVFMAVLLVSRLEAASFSTFIILIPIFAILGCCLCAVACGFCMASCVDTTEFQEEGVEPSSATAQQKQENNDIEAHDIKGFEAELPTAMRSSPAAAPSSPSRSPIQVDNTPVNPSSVTLEVTHIDADID